MKKTAPQPCKTILVAFPAQSRGQTVIGHVVRYVKKRPGHGYVIVRYRVRLENGCWSKPIRTCFPVANGRILDVIGRKTVTKPVRKKRK